MVGSNVYLVKEFKMKRTILMFLLGIGILSARSQEWNVSLYDTVPDFVVKNKAGDVVDIQSLRGSVVLVNFFATWCPPCRRELPRLQKEVWDRWGERDDFAVMVLAREEGWDKLDPFIAKANYTFPIYPDPKRAVFSLFADSTIPRNVLIDRNGKIIYQSIGYVEAEFSELIKLIETTLTAENG